MIRKKHFLPLLLGWAGLFAMATAFGTDNATLDEPKDDGVFLARPSMLKTYQDCPEWDLLPKATDFEDENIGNARQRLIDEGEAAYEGLLAIVTECEDKWLARIALGILRATSGDKHKSVEKLRPFFIRRLPVAGAAEGWLLTDIARYLADFGTEDDMDALFPLLDHPNWRMRTAGAHYLGQSGGERALKALERARSRDSDKTVLQAIDQAILRIEQRLEPQLVSEDSEAELAP